MGRGARKRRRQLQRLQQHQQPTSEQQQAVNPGTPTQALVRRWMAAAVSVSSYAGPLPPPDILKQYNEIEPGLADRIVRMAEGQARHRQSLESAVILSRAGSERQGQWLGFAIALVAIIDLPGEEAPDYCHALSPRTRTGCTLLRGHTLQGTQHEAHAGSPDGPLIEAWPLGTSL